ncbi:CotG/ExsB N-terminal domain-containing protein [Bacillus sp. AFS031507]|uniref:CotG/ExsB N-terminal domain-containing protein n=1 Tax=Bacillus sp. AFS031507 TaxID=2033496 RepID=UPI0026CC0540
MSDFSAEDIQRAADEVRRGGFGDFMFRDPGQNRGTTRRRTSGRRMTLRRNTSRRNTSGNRNTSRRNTSRRNTSRRNTSRRRTSRRNTSRRNTSRRRTSRRRTSRCCKWSGWRYNSRSNTQINRCWKDGNMWNLRVRRR